MLSEKAKWIACNPSLSSPVIYKKIEIKEFQEAEIKICGLGYYELFINGNRVGDEFFKPAFSDYCERDFSHYLYPLHDKTSHTIYYNTWQAGKFLHAGENIIAVLLGNGFYRQTRRDIEGKMQFGDSLVACFELTIIHNGFSICYVTDGTERAAASFIQENNLFYGETHDYSSFDFNCFKKGLSMNEGTAVTVVPAPRAKIEEQHCPNDRIMRTLNPVIVSKKNGKVIYDATENISGFVTCVARSERVIIRHAETLNEEGELDFFSAGSADQISQTEYKFAQGRTVHPWFCWSGFRFFEVTGEIENVQVYVVHGDIAVSSFFRCGNENIQWLYEAYIRTQLNNMHGGVPSDCPHRERLGYTGDGQLCAETAMLLLDSRSFYEKWMRDIADCQDVSSGHVQHTAPFCGGGGGPGGWGGAMALVPYYYYKTFGNKAIIKKYFTNIERFLDCMKGFCKDGLVVREREKGWCLGEWCTPEAVALPEPYVNTYYYIVSMKAAQYLASEIGRNVDYSLEIEKSLKAIKQSYFNPETGSFCNGTQGADAFALALGLGDKRTEKNFITHYEKIGRFDTGIFGTDLVAQELVKRGHARLLCRILSGEEFPSFGFMRKRGATTLWEDWNGKSSHDHPMFGACVKQIVFGLLGIEGDIGYKSITINAPYLPELRYVEAEFALGGGKLYLKIDYSQQKAKVFARAQGIRVSVKNDESKIEIE